MISNNIFTSDIVSGQHFYSDKLIARTPQGLHIVDDEDNGMFLEDGGNIGIGTTTPDLSTHGVHVKGVVNSMVQVEGAAGDSIIGLGTPSDLTQSYAIQHTRSTNSLSIGSPNSISSDSPPISLLNSNVGIGTASPDHRLHIVGGSTADPPPSMKIEGPQPRIWLRETDQTDLNTLIRNNNGVFEIDTVEDGDTYIQNRFAINHGNGNVRINDLLGIGKDPDGYHLDVAAPGASANGIRVQTNNASANAIVHIGVGGSADIKFKVDGSGSVTTAKDVTIGGNLTVNGTTTTVNSTTLTVDDKNIEIGSIDAPTNTTADGGGITLKGATDKEFKWTNSSNAWNSSENLGIADGKYLFTDKVRARDGAGLFLEDDGGNGIFVQDGGNVGIGTATPDRLLDVQNSGGHAFVSIVGKNDSRAAILLGDTDSDSQGRIDYDNSDNHLHFSTAATERMRIDSSGNVGIGTTNPTARLVVEESNTSPAHLGRFTNDSGQAIVTIRAKSDNLSILEFADADDANIGAINYSHASNYMRLKTADVERLSIDSSGRVGIGTISPGDFDSEANHLVIKGQNNTGMTICAGNTTSRSNIYFADGTSGGAKYRGGVTYDHGTNDLSLRAGGLEALWVLANGKVGIGTGSPEEPLDVRGTIKTKNDGDDSEIKLVSSGGMPYINLQRGSSALGNWKITAKGNGSQQVLTTSVGTSELMTVQGDGNVGIGTTSPNYNLHITGGTPAMKLEGTQPRIFLRETDQTDLNTLIRNNGSLFQIDTVTDADAFVANRLTVNHTSGNVGIGTANPGQKLEVSAGHLFVNNGQGIFKRNSTSAPFYAEQEGSGPAGVFIGGNVGIGTTSPSSKLHVKGLFGSPDTTGSSNNGIARFGQASGAGVLDVGFGDPYSWLQSRASNDYSTNYALSLQPNGGSVGIGTTNPSQKLHVYGTTLLESSNAKLCVCANGKIEIQATVEVDDDGGNKGLWFGDIGESQAKGYIGGGAYAVNGLGANDFGMSSSAGNNLAFGINGVEKMRIASNGNVGIGTATPESTLHVAGKATIQSSGPVLVLKDTDGGDVNSQNGFIDYRDQNDVQRAYIGFGSSADKDFSMWSMIGDLRFGTGTGQGTAGQVKMWIRANGTVEIPGNLVVTGTTTTNNVETVSTSNGVIFEGSATDDHEGTLKAGTLNADRTYTLPDATGLIALTSNIGNGAITITAGGGLTGGGSFDTNQASAETITINHQDTSTASSVNNSGRTYIQDIGLDGYGHITSLASATASNATVNVTAGGALTGGGSFTLDGGGGTITLNHQDTSSQSSSNNTGRTYIQDISLDAYGHVTGIGTATETVINTDTNTTYSAGNHLTLTGTQFSVNRDLRGGTDPSTGVYAIGQNNQSYFIVHGILTRKAETYLGGTLVSKQEEGGDLHVGADVIAFSTTVSDKKFKDNIGQIKGGLEKVKKLRGVEFDWNATSRKGTKDIGVIAQEVEEVVPEVVTEKVPCVGEFCENTEKYKTVDYARLVPVLIEAIKDLSEEVEELKKKLS